MHVPDNQYGLILFISLAFLSFHSFAQEELFKKEIDLNCKNCTLIEILEKIEDKVNYYFSYNTDLISERENITVDFTKTELKTILDSLFADTTLYYKIVEKQILISDPDNKVSSELKIIPGISHLPVKIEGIVFDRTDDQPIAFANVSVFGKSIGTVSNLDGKFILKLPSGFISDTIGISCIGYKTLLLSVPEALNQNKFALEQDIVPIQEVIIRNTDPLNLIKAALKKIPENYYQKPSVLTSFYRETIKKSDHFISITEAVLQTFKPGYKKTYFHDQIKLLKSRRTENIHADDTILVKLKAGLNTTLLLDLIKNPAEFLQEEYFYYYKFKLSDIIIENDQETYVIDFKQKDGITEPLYYGKIYIDVKNLAIKAFYFSLNEERIEKAWDRFVVKKPAWLKVRPVKASYQVVYKQYAGKYFLNLIRSETVFKIRNRKELFRNEFSSFIEMAVTQIDTSETEPFKSRDILNTETILNEEFNQSTDRYWADYNYIKPDEPLEKAMQKLISGSK